MDKDIADLKEVVGRIDERTIATHDTVEEIRGDFKDVAVRVTKVETNQKWFLRIGSTLGALAVAAIGVVYKINGGV